MRKFLSVCLFLLLCLFPCRLWALTPPGGDETRCYVEGEILSHQKEEGTDMQMNRLMVKAIALHVHVIRPIEENDQSAFCRHMSGFEQMSGKKINVFRLCDETDARDGKMIKGIVGRSLGGGPYCIEQIEVVE